MVDKVELIVVIAIVGLLSAISVPLYQSYRWKTKLAALPSIVDTINKEFVLNYSTKGVFAYKYDGANISSNVHISLYEYPFAPWFWWSPQKNDSSSSRIMWSMSLRNIEGIDPNYASPQGGNSAKSGFFVALIAKNGVVSTICGYYGAAESSLELPEAYMPKSCKCINVGLAYNNGTGYSCPE